MGIHLWCSHAALEKFTGQKSVKIRAWVLGNRTEACGKAQPNNSHWCKTSLGYGQNFAMSIVHQNTPNTFDSKNTGRHRAVIFHTLTWTALPCRHQEEGRGEEAQAGTQPARAVHPAPGGDTRAEVSAHALPKQRRRRRTVRRSQSHRDTGQCTIRSFYTCACPGQTADFFFLICMS